MSKTTTYVEFYYPGIMVDEASVKVVNHRDSKKVNVPSGSFGFRFFDVKSTEEGDVKMESDRLNLSPMYYYGGRIMTLDDVRREMPNDRILISNMESNGWSRVIKCRTGNFKPFDGGDVHIKA
jgi:hypothetical protein